MKDFIHKINDILTLMLFPRQNVERDWLESSANEEEYKERSNSLRRWHKIYY